MSATHALVFGQTLCRTAQCPAAPGSDGYCGDHGGRGVPLVVAPVVAKARSPLSAAVRERKYRAQRAKRAAAAAARRAAQQKCVVPECPNLLRSDNSTGRCVPHAQSVHNARQSAARTAARGAR